MDTTSSTAGRIKVLFRIAWSKQRHYLTTFWVSFLLCLLMVAIPMFLLLSHVPVVAIYISSLFLAGPLLSALKMQAVCNVNNESPKVRQLLSYLNKHFWQLFFITPIFIALFVLPLLGFIFFIFFQFFDVLMIEKNLKPIKALSSSFTTVKKNFLLVAGTNIAAVFLLILLMIVPLLLINIWSLLLLAVMLIFYFPFVANLYGLLYKTIFSTEKQ